jgi:hypothetical protein
MKKKMFSIYSLKKSQYLNSLKFAQIQNSKFKFETWTQSPSV